MADEEQERRDEGNGGPVTPGAEAPHGGAHGTGKNGHAGTDVVARSDTADTPETSAKPEKPVPVATRGRMGGVWLVLTLSAVVLVFLLIFIVQNDVDIPIKFLGLAGTLPSGVALLFAAALGILLAAIPGYGRILQLRRALRRSNTKH